MTQIPEVAYTHAGKFHADDVFSAALLRILRPNIRFVRAMGLPEGFDGFAFDIGWGRFDHHQNMVVLVNNVDVVIIYSVFHI